MTDLDAQWARSRVDAMADGSLTAAEVRRMRAEMARDPQLRTALQRAAKLHVALRGLDRGAVPPTLRRRLFAIAGGRDARRSRVPAWALPAGAAATIAIAMGALAMLQVQNAREREAAAAMAQVEVAMAYLNRSSQIAGDHVLEAVRTGFRAAAETSRRTLSDEEPQTGNGE